MNRQEKQGTPLRNQQSGEALRGTQTQKNKDPASGVDSLWKLLRRNLSFGALARQIKKMFRAFRAGGLQGLRRELDFRVRLATHKETWQYRVATPLKKELKAQQKVVFPLMPVVSVVVPLYNTPANFLRQMMDSVCAQSYRNFELVLANASDKDHPEVQQIVEEYAKKDARINAVRLFKNTGIAENTNIGIAESTGEWIALLDHDDVLQPHALYEVVKAANEHLADLVYSDEVVLDATLEHLQEYHFKPDYGPDTLRGCNYITHLCAFNRSLMEKAGGGERSEYDGAQDYDLILRLSEKAEKIHHIPKALYFWRSHESSTASGMDKKEYAMKAGAAAVQAHLERVGLTGVAQVQEEYPGAYRVQYETWGQPLVSVIIPSKDHIDDLERCLSSLFEKAGWDNLEVLVLDNNSTDPATETYYEHAEQTYPKVQVLRYPGAFNFAAICNFGAARAKGSQLLFLNNDMEMISDGFIREMLSYSQRPDVGAVGAKLYYPDGTIQHAGLFVGIGGTAGVSHKGHDKDNAGNMFRLVTAQNMSAVTGAALMVKKSAYDMLGGMDEENFAVAFNDVDLCLRLRKRKLWNVFTPFADAWHFESKSRGYDLEGSAKQRFDKEAAAFKAKYATILQEGDPFYNPNLTLKYENYACV